MARLRIAYAGDRDISVWVLDFLLAKRVNPLALLVTEEGKATHANDLIQRCPFLDGNHIFRGKQFREPASLDMLRSLNLDYIVGIHFPYIIPGEVLTLPRYGVMNLHPAYLPYNRGWHTPSWALLENTPIGATLHFMAEQVDAGDIIHQKPLEPSPGDTAHSLYTRLKQLELEVFQEAWEHVAEGNFRRQPQQLEQGTSHKRADLFTDAVQKIDLDETVNGGDLLRKLRALTTNDINEAAFYEVDGKRYRVQVSIHEEK